MPRERNSKWTLRAIDRLITNRTLPATRECVVCYDEQPRKYMFSCKVCNKKTNICQDCFIGMHRHQRQQLEMEEGGGEWLYRNPIRCPVCRSEPYKMFTGRDPPNREVVVVSSDESETDSSETDGSAWVVRRVDNVDLSQTNLPGIEVGEPTTVFQNVTAIRVAEVMNMLTANESERAKRAVRMVQRYINKYPVFVSSDPDSDNWMTYNMDTVLGGGLMMSRSASEDEALINGIAYLILSYISEILEHFRPSEALLAGVLLNAGSGPTLLHSPIWLLEPTNRVAMAFPWSILYTPPGEERVTPELRYNRFSAFYPVFGAQVCIMCHVITELFSRATQTTVSTFVATSGDHVLMTDFEGVSSMSLINILGERLLGEE